jgi:hypothetical protein
MRLKEIGCTVFGITVPIFAWLCGKNNSCGQVAERLATQQRGTFS